VARALGMGELIVPPSPGILCAQGLVVSDLKEDFVASGRFEVETKSLAQVTDALAGLADQARRWATDSAGDTVSQSLELSLDMRYVGQNFELRVGMGQTDGAGASPPLPDADTLRRRFFEEHERNYGFHNPDDPVEIVNIRLTAHGHLRQPESAAEAAADGAPPAPAETRDVWFDADAPVATPVYDRAGLRPGQAIDGPAVVDQLDATTVVFPGDRVRVDGHLNLIVELRHDD
jgi:N-methylhydantoinase A